MIKTWILVTDASRARIFQMTSKVAPWELVREIDHPEGRAKGRDIMADRPGRTQQSVGVAGMTTGGARSAIDPPTDPKEVAAERFALELADLLDKAYSQHEYGRLVLVAPPHFLGLLRKSLTDQVAKHVHETLDKDFTTIEARELPRRLADVV